MFSLVRVWLFAEAGLSGFEEAAVRVVLSALTAFLVALTFGAWFLPVLRRAQLLDCPEKGDSQRLDDIHAHKKTTPTMGGVILLVAVVCAVVVWGRLESPLLGVLLLLTLALGALGMVDDFIQLRTSRKGLKARTKFGAQLVIAGFAGVFLLAFPPSVFLGGAQESAQSLYLPWAANGLVGFGVFYVAWVALVTTGSSNAVNLTDGLDGLATGCTVLVAVIFAAVAIAAGHSELSAALSIPHVVGGAEVAVFAAALAGGGLGFLWFNCHPAQVFMGDTGALPLGGALGMLALLTKQELLLFLVGGVLVAEALSVILQVFSFKMWRKRIFLIAPLHHHFQFKGWTETRVTVSFWVVAAGMGIVSVLALSSSSS